MNLSGNGVRILFYASVSASLLFFTILLAYTVRSTQPVVPVLICIAGICCCLAMPWLVISVMRDHRTIEHMMAENMARYHAIIAASNTGAWEYHSDTKHQWCSPEYFEMLGYNSKEFMKDDKLHIQDIWMSLLHPDDRQAAIDKFATYISKKSPEMYEAYFRMKHKNGQWIWIWSRGRTLPNPDGSMSNITLGTHIDITKRKLMEIDLLKHNAKLIKYAHLTAHEVRGPVARLLGLVSVLKITPEADYAWFVDKMNSEALEIDKILKIITSELNEIDVVHA